MKHFAALFTQLEQSTKANVKVKALTNYFAAVGDQDRMWTIAMLSDRKPKRILTPSLLQEWALAASNLPLWLFEASLLAAGDLLETITLILPPPNKSSHCSLCYWMDFIQAMVAMEASAKKEKVLEAWDQLSPNERFVFNKIITGRFRLRVSQKQLVKALAQFTGLEENSLAHRLMGKWTPDDTTFASLILSENKLDDIAKPYPFCSADPLEEQVEALGDPSDWQAEYKWGGIRGQLILRKEQLFLWSREGELLTAKVPEFAALAPMLPDGTVIDGEILAFKAERPLSFLALQARVGFKNISKKILADTPVILMAYDLLEWQGKDLRSTPLTQRRELLERLLAAFPNAGPLQLSPIIHFNHWETIKAEQQLARQHDSEGIMLKRKAAPYSSDRKRDDWWSWKADPLRIDAVLIYAQRGQGQLSNVYTNFTFAVWEGAQLVPFTKAHSGLTAAALDDLTEWVAKNTIERFGPVRAVTPYHVFEIAFEGIEKSKRHKSGVVLKLPRILRWRKDKDAKAANTLADLHQILI